MLGWLLAQTAVAAGSVGLRCGGLGAAGALLCALVLAVQVVDTGSVAIGFGGAEGNQAIGWVTDRVSMVLLLLVLGVGTVVQVFARRYLAGDPRAAWFALCTGLVTTASAGLVTAATLVTLAGCWSARASARC